MNEWEKFKAAFDRFVDSVGNAVKPYGMHMNQASCPCNGCRIKAASAVAHRHMSAADLEIMKLRVELLKYRTALSDIAGNRCYSPDGKLSYPFQIAERALSDGGTSPGTPPVACRAGGHDPGGGPAHQGPAFVQPPTVPPGSEAGQGDTDPLMDEAYRLSRRLGELTGVLPAPPPEVPPAGETCACDDKSPCAYHSMRSWSQPAPTPGVPAVPCRICHLIGTHSMGCDYGGKGMAVPVEGVCVCGGRQRVWDERNGWVPCPDCTGRPTGERGTG